MIFRVPSSPNQSVILWIWMVFSGNETSISDNAFTIHLTTVRMQPLLWAGSFTQPLPRNSLCSKVRNRYLSLGQHELLQLSLLLQEATKVSITASGELRKTLLKPRKGFTMFFLLCVLVGWVPPHQTCPKDAFKQCMLQGMKKMV